MTVEPLVPDAPLPEPPSAGDRDVSLFGKALDAVGSSLSDAQQAEDAFATGGGSLADAMYDRARADVMLSVATATAQRCAQAIGSITSMQV